MGEKTCSAPVLRLATPSLPLYPALLHPVDLGVVSFHSSKESSIL